MAENSKIEWTDHTFNPWIGCAKVHAGCTHCYAETLMDHRYGKVQWGPGGTRVRTSDANWRKPLQWNRAAEKAGRPALVFCASLADVFEDRDDLVEHRRDLFCELIDATPHLTWLVLTKRPENVRGLWPEFHTSRPVFPGMPGPMGEPLPCVVTGHPRTNVWLGTSPCDQATADVSIPELLKVRALCGGLFLSCEPLVGPLEIPLTLETCPHCGLDTEPHGLRESRHEPFAYYCSQSTCTDQFPLSSIDWVIVGGESGHGFRPMQTEWAASIVDQCQAAGVPVFIKQMAGKAEIPAGLQVRQFPAAFGREPTNA